MGKITTLVAENWDPYQVDMKEIMTEAKEMICPFQSIWAFSMAWQSCWGW